MIANTFLNRPVTAIVISVVIVLVGVLAIYSLPVSQYPDITPPTVQISGVFNGADAQTVAAIGRRSISIGLLGIHLEQGDDALSLRGREIGRPYPTAPCRIHEAVDVGDGPQCAGNELL